MTCPTTQDITIKKGKTFRLVTRWETLPFVYKAISGITRAAPAVITASAHGLPDGWRTAVVSAEGMKEINAKSMPPASDEFKKATVLTSSTVELNEVNSAEFRAYTSGGYLMYYTPVDLDGYTARLQVRATEQATGAPLLSLTSSAGITLDNTNKTITITISAADTADLDFATGVYELEMEDGSGVVDQLLKGTVTVEPEVVR